MDFAIIQGKNGVSEMSWVKSTDIGNLLYFSINIQKGTLFNDPDFGLDLSDLKKVTDSTVDIIKNRIEKAVKWIVDIKRAVYIDVIIEKNLQTIGRIDISVTALQADGTPVELKTFRSVGGAA